MQKWGFLVPLLLPLMLYAGISAGGAWTWAPVVFVFGFVPLLDLVLGRETRNSSPEEARVLEAEPFYRRVLHAWVPLQFAMLAWIAWKLGVEEFAVSELVGIAVSAGTLTGAIGITIAHELGHKLDATDRRLARLLLMSVCYAHFQVEHNKGHHARVATPLDPASARRGQSLYAFLPQTVIGSFASAWHFERVRLARVQRSPWTPGNQVLQGIAGSSLMLLLASFTGGINGALFFLAQSAVAIVLLEIVNYVEHYGLERAAREGGGYERVEVVHSWNASERFTNWFLFNLQRHSHHHVEHHRRYQVLRHVPESPQLPTGYAGMVLLALLPPVWKSVMNRRLEKWKEGKPS